VEQQTRKIEAASTGPKPTGLGGLSQQIIDREVGDWNRFQRGFCGGSISLKLNSGVTGSRNKNLNSLAVINCD